MVGSIRDVAREAGLSVATVSRVINGSSPVRPATKERVMAACKQLDYVPNPAARTLSTRRSRTVAAIIPTIEHSVFAKYVTAVERALSEKNYALVLAISNADSDEELTAAEQLLGMGAEAFILSGFDHSAELLDLLKRRSVPHVFTSVWEHRGARPVIGYDNSELAFRAVSYLKKRGHRKIAAVHGPLFESDRTRARRLGAENANNGALDIDFFEMDLSVEGGKDAVTAILSASKNYSAALCFSDVLALGVYFALSERGINVPQDMSVMGFDNLDWSAHVVPPLTTINLPAEEMGRKVVEQLVNVLEESEAIVPTKLSANIIERQSVADIGTGKED
ncbi:MAG: LacI family DNA-binding transcriptional regulator [Pseudomonadota bacterium]